jgi:hypothetical protein
MATLHIPISGNIKCDMEKGTITVFKGRTMKGREAGTRAKGMTMRESIKDRRVAMVMAMTRAVRTARARIIKTGRIMATGMEMAKRNNFL